MAAAGVPGPSLKQLVGQSYTLANLTYESSVDLCQRVNAKQTDGVVTPADRLDTTAPGPVVASVGHAGSVVCSPLTFLHAMVEAVQAQPVLPPPLAWWTVTHMTLGFIWQLDLSPPDGNPLPELRLSSYAQALAGRQRGQWSERMAIGLAAMLHESWRQHPNDTAGPLIDVDIASFDDAVTKHHIAKAPGAPPQRRPDYIAYRETNNVEEVIAFECKGHDGQRIANAGSLATGVRQVLAVDPGQHPLTRWVVAAGCGVKPNGVWHPAVVEIAQAPAALPAPAPAVAAGPAQPLSSVVEVIERRGVSKSLELAGQPDLADRVRERPPRARRREEPPLVERQDDQGRVYRGTEIGIDLGALRLTTFYGVAEEIRSAVESDAVDQAVAARRARGRERRQEPGSQTGYTQLPDDGGALGPASLSDRGTLLAVTVR